MKRSLALLLTFIVCLSFAVPAFANGNEEKTNILEGIYPDREQYVPVDPEFSGVKVSEEMRKTLKTLIDSNITTLKMLLKPAYWTGDIPDYFEVTGPDSPFKLNLKRFPMFKDLENFLSDTYTKRVVDAFFAQGEYYNNNGELWMNMFYEASMGEYSIYSEYKVIVVELTDTHCYFDLDVPQYEEFTGDNVIAQSKIRYEAVKDNGVWKLTDVFYGARLYDEKVTIDGWYFYQGEEILDDPIPQPETPTTTGNTPNTADEMSIVPFAAAAILSCMAIVYVTATRRKISKEK